MIVYAYDPKKRTRIKAGEIVNSTLYKKAKKDHYCWKHKGWGIQESVFINHDFSRVKILSHKGTKHKSLRSQWIIRDDLGNGPQRFLAEKDMETVK